MTKFKDLLSSQSFNRSIEFPSVSVTHKKHTLELKFDSKDVLVSCGYTGSPDPWLSSLCLLITDKSLTELLVMSMETWDKYFQNDELYWEFKTEESEKLLFAPLEMLHAALDIFRGREYLYQEASPLVCRCFGVRENDILDHLQKEAVPTLETLATASKAGMGCRSCVPQLKRWLVLKDADSSSRHFKNIPFADWLIRIDEKLASFPAASDWKFEVQKIKGQQVFISYDKEVSQREEEAMGLEIQRFLGSAVDSDLGFFIKRLRHFSNARG